MRCKKCGYVFFEETSSCPKCGADIDEVEEETLLIEDEETEETAPLFIEAERTGKSERKKTTPTPLQLPFEEETKIEKRILIPAPIGIRAGASLIDFVIVVAIGLLTTLIPYYACGGGKVTILQVIFWIVVFILETIIYFSLFHYLMGSTLGKSFFEIEIAAQDKELNFPLCLLKSILGFILTLPFFLTWIYSLINEEEVPLHDAMLGVLSIEKE
jgi:uncharacterized RDD family membrane protein YckC/RNA polymerase subunit RPABC4/transcription elongation factor Spt4